jgi:hypothetical protein
MLHFKHVFVALMSLSFLSAFVAPPRLTDGGRAQLEGLFIPISRPTYAAANWLRRKISPDVVQDARPDADIRNENLRLQEENLRLQAQVQQLQTQVHERQSLGDLQSYCERFGVAGADSGSREGLILGGSLLTNVAKGQAVISKGSLVGRIDRAGLNAAHVRLVSDPGFTVTGRLGRVGNDDNSAPPDVAIIIEGAGAGKMRIDKLSRDQIRSLHIVKGDWIVLEDPSFPWPAQGLRVGQVESIQTSLRDPLFAQITLTSAVDLMQLPNVWVMTHAD